MFKIDRVVIRGEKPKSCNECPYSIYDAESDGYICYAMVVSEQDNLITDTHTCPDWCPLVVEPEPHTFKNTEVGEPWGKPTDFSKHKTLGKWQMGHKESEE